MALADFFIFQFSKLQKVTHPRKFGGPAPSPNGTTPLVFTSANPLSPQFIECVSTKPEFISIVCSVINNIGKSKIASLKDKIAPQFQQLLQSPL